MTKLKILASYCSALGVMSSLAVAAQTQALPTPSVAVSAGVVPFRIAPQPVGEALKEFASQAGMQLIYETDAISATARTPGLTGTVTPEACLSQLLAHTNLGYKFINARTVAIGFLAADENGAESQPRSSPPPSGPQAVPNVTGLHGSEPEEVVVTAQKREERIQNVPISISVVSGGDLDRSRVQGVAEALTAVPGVATTQDYLGGGTSVVIRGVSASFPQESGSSPVAYYLDSVPFGLVKSAVAPDANAYDLERVEVLRGPQGTLYGAGGEGGVVRILTHDADLSHFDIKARLMDSGTQYGGNNYRGDAAINLPIVDDKLAVRAVAGYANNSGWIDQPNAKDVNDSEETSLRLKLNAKPTDALSVALSAWRSRFQAAAPDIGYTFDKSATVLPQPVKTTYDAYNAKIDYQLPWFSISSATSYLDYFNKGDVGLDVDPFNANGIFGETLGSNVFAEEVNLNSAPSQHWRWSAGAIYRRATEKVDQIFTVFDVPELNYEDISKSYAVYGELTRLLFDGRLELTAGLRHFHDDITQVESLAPGTPVLPSGLTAEANTPRAVITWHVNPNLMTYLSYSQGFRSGFPQDSSLPVAFAPAQPDRLRNYEAGSKGSFLDGRIAYDASVYYMNWRGIQQEITVFPPVDYTLIVNGQGASGVGTDLALAVSPVKNFTLRASVSWNDLRLDSDILSGGNIVSQGLSGGVALFRKGDRLTASPETTAGASGDYRFGLGSSGLTADVLISANYTSSLVYRNLVGTDVVIQAGDPITIVRASFEINSADHWTATLFADNLNNEKGSPVEAFVGTVNWNSRVRPRTVGLQLEYHWR